jgi:hypothetical protein
MELIIMAVALVALGMLATLFGADSRDWPRCSEQRFADFGAVWPDALLHEAVRPHRTDPDRLRVAMLLTALPLLHS